MSNVSEWSPTAGLNTASPPDGWPEGMARSAVNDGMREVQAAIARWYKDTNAFLVSAGSAPTYTLTTQTVYNSYTDVGTLTWLAHAPSTSAPATLNVDGLGAKDLVFRDGTDLYIGDIRTNTIVAVVYNGALDRFEMMHDAGDRPGTIKEWAGLTEPPGWLFAAGQEVLRADHPYLFGVIGETFGEGDGSTTFELPDRRGRVAAGRDDMGGDDAERLDDFMDSEDLGATGGTQGEPVSQDHLESFTLPDTLVPADHFHAFSDTLDFNDTSWGASLTTGTTAVQGGGAVLAITTAALNQGTLSGSVTGFTGTASALAINGSVTSGGDGDDLSKVQPTIIMNFIIKT